MTKKEKKKFIKELVELELIHRNPASTDQERRQAEDKIMALTNHLMQDAHYLSLMFEIDEMVQEELNNKEK